MPLKAGFAKVEATMNEVVGDEWYCSNVYDLDTNQPLNW